MNKEIMKALGFAEEVQAVEMGKCPFCHKTIRAEDFKDELSAKDYKITGLCQTCQDEIYA